MARPDQPDLFGPARQQSEMFEEHETRIQRQPVWSDKYGWIEPVPSGGYTPETIRARMLKLLAEARAADQVPWTPRMAHSHTVMFPVMAEWLPKEEGEQLLLEFETEMERLRKAA